MSDAAPWESDAVVSAPTDKPWLADAAVASKTTPAPRVGWAEENLAGPSEVIGSAVANIPHAAAHAAVDIYRRLTGGNTDAPDPAAVQAIKVPMGAGGQQLLGDAAAMLPARSTDNSATDETRIPEFSPGTQDVIRNTVQVGGDVANIAPVAGLVKSGVSALGDAVATKPQTIAEAAQAAAGKSATSGNAGAAGTAVDTSKITPESQAELARIGESSGAVNSTALGRIHEAESLPVPVRLTAGQARGDTGMISDEFNSKGQENNAIGNRYDEQDQALKDNLLTLHREASPDTVANNSIQNGQSVIDSLKRYDQPKVAEINGAYKAAKDANGGDLQMDGSGFADAAKAALKPQGRADFLPASAQKIIDRVDESGGKMSLDDFEGYRTALANEARKAQISGDGNAVAAISKVRDALEATQPADSTSAAGKALYDKARGLAKARFSELDADPAYKAAVNDDAPIGEQSDLADKFTDKYVLNGSKAALQRLRPKLDEEGGHAMTSSAMNFLQSKAGINPDTGAGKFSNAGYNAGLTKITPKVQELLGDQDLIDNTRKIGNVANYTQNLSRGAYANTSHTFVAEKAAEIGEHAINAAAHGLPVGTAARKFLASRSSAAKVREVLKPGAGLED
jgi:hypothetical protein